MLTFFFLSVTINPSESSEDVTILTKDLEENFFSDFKSNEKTIFLLGSSQTARLNHNYIQNELVKNGLNYEIYNLAINGDEPKKRLQSINEIISLKPEFVIYGVGYNDFANQKIKVDTTRPPSVLPDFSTLFNQFIDYIEDSKNLNFDRWLSPKIQSLNLIKNLLGIEDNQGKINLTIENAPFYTLRQSHSVILDEMSLRRSFESANTQFGSISSENENVIAFKQYIKILNDNQITPIIFTFPLSDISANTISNKDKESFNEILSVISQEYVIELHPYHEKFGNSPIWNDPVHVAFGEQSIILNDVIKNIILEQ